MGAAKTEWIRIGVLLGVAFLFAASLPTVSSQQLPSNIKYELIIDCPERRVGLPQGRPQDGPPRPLDSLMCPVLARDEDDIMGSPSIAVDPNNPKNLILASLHGTDVKGPTDRSRGRQPFTSFFSHDHGGNWQDRPFYPPNMCGLVPGARFGLASAGSMGEHPQAAIDKYGHVFIGSLYSTPRDSAPSGYNYTIVAQKFESLERLNRSQGMNGDYNAQCVHTFYRNNVVEQFWFVFDEDSQIATIIWNEMLPQKGGELSPEPDPESKSVLGMAWTTPHPRERWHKYPVDNLTGPCLQSTNPVLSEGWIYVGCVVNATGGKYRWSDQVDNGQIDIIRYEVTTQKPEYLGRAPVTGGTPRLGVRSDGRVALMSIEVTPEGQIKLVGAFGQADTTLKAMSWKPPKQYGDKIFPLAENEAPIEINIQDMLYRETSGVVQMVIKQRFRERGLTIDNPLSFSQSFYTKHLIAIDEKHHFLKRIDFDIGDPRNRTTFSTSEIDQPNAVFNDLTDDVLQIPPTPDKPFEFNGIKLPKNYQREFIAMGDYGIVQFAEVIEITNIEAPGVPPPGGVGSPALAAPTVALNPAYLLLAVTSVAVVGLLAVKLAMNRSKSYNVAITKGGK